MASNAGSARKGKATEQLIAAIAVLGTAGELNAFSALVDDEGVDLGFKPRDGTRVLDVQVKARFSDEAGSKRLRERGVFVADVRKETFRPRNDLWMLYAVVDGASADIDRVWLVPSTVLAEEGFVVRPSGKQLVRFQASAKADSHDKWTKYRLTRAELPQRLLEVTKALEADD